MFAPRFFGVRHFAPRHFAPGLDEIQIPEPVKPRGGGYGGFISADDAKRANLAKQAFDKRQREWDEDLSQIIEAAFNRELNKAGIAGPQKKKPVKTIRKKVTRRVYDAVKTDEMGFKLAEIARLIDDYAEVISSYWLDIIRRQDEDAIILLLLEA